MITKRAYSLHWPGQDASTDKSQVKKCLEVQKKGERFGLKA